MKTATLVWALVWALGLGACRKPSPVSAEAAEKPEAGGLRESELGRVILSPEAVHRLGIATAEMELKEVRPMRTYSGEISVPTNQQTAVTTMINGFVQLDLDTVPGALVRAGQRLFRLMPPTSQSSLKSMDVQREKTERDRLASEVNSARTEYRHQQELFRQGKGSAEAADRARAELAAIETAAVTAIKAEYVVASEGAAQYEFASPQAGVILQVLVGRGQYVTVGTLVVRLAALDPLWVRVPVYSGDWNRIARSAAAEVQPLATGPASAARMAKSIAGPPTADAPTSTADLYYEVPNPGLRLRPGERVKVRLPLTGAEKRLAAARGSVVYDVHGNAWVYEAVSSTEFVRRQVDVDYTTDTAVVLTSGPKAGTRVVSVGVSELFGAEFGAAK